MRSTLAMAMVAFNVVAVFTEKEVDNHPPNVGPMTKPIPLKAPCRARFDVASPGKSSASARAMLVDE